MPLTTARAGPHLRATPSPLPPPPTTTTALPAWRRAGQAGPAAPPGGSASRRCRAQASSGSQDPDGPGVPPARPLGPQRQAGAAAAWAAQQGGELDPNVWASKPAWCQPATILATGAAVVGGVWASTGGSPGWATAAALPVAAWWWLFLGVMPAQFREYAEGVNAELRRQKAAGQRQPRGL